MDQGDVEDVEEEGDASEHGDDAGESAARVFQERDQRDDWAQGHQEEVERSGVLRAVEEGEECGHRRRAVVGDYGMMPGAGIAVEIEAPEQQEKSDGSEAYQQTDLFSAGGFERENFAEGVAYGHYTDPGDERVEHDQVGAVGAKLYGACEKSDVADFPEGGEFVCVHAFEEFSDVRVHQVVGGDDDYADCCCDREG